MGPQKGHEYKIHAYTFSVSFSLSLSSPSFLNLR